MDAKMDASQLHAFAQRYTAAWCSQQPTQVASCYSPTGSLQVNDDAPATGRAAITELAESFMTVFPDLHLAMDDLLIQQDHAVYHWTLSGTNAGTGHRVRISGLEVWKFGPDNLIAESKGHFDEASYRHQLTHETEK